MRFRVTVRGDQGNRVELRGFIDGGLLDLNEFSEAMKPYGLVIASVADDDYWPWSESTESDCPPAGGEPWTPPDA